jgi:hypothetical protein
MCGPALPLILTTAASAVSTLSQYHQQTRTQAKQYEREATIARQQAVFESQRQQRDIRRRLGALHAAGAAAGVQSGSGSLLDIAANYAAEAELDPFETIRQGLIQYQDLRFAAQRAKSAAGTSLIGDAIGIGGDVTRQMKFFQ